MYPIQVQLKYLLQYAILAPSTKNTQPWRFSVGENTVGIFADLTRWQPVSDRGRRELYISLGCALENLLVAAEQFGFRHSVRYFPQPSNDELAATVAFQPGGEVSDTRAGIALHSIIARYTERGGYQDEPIVEELRRRLLECCCVPDLRVDLTDDAFIRARVVELNLHADEMEFSDPNYRKELGYWVGQGVFGTPRLLARPLGFLLKRLNLGQLVGNRNAVILFTSPLIGMISARKDDRISQVRTGQVLERLWLRATRLGMALQPMSQALEIPSVRAQLARVIPEREWIPEQVFRIGYPAQPDRKHTPRRPLDQVLLG
jgi:nitroreductase